MIRATGVAKNDLPWTAVNVLVPASLCGFRIALLRVTVTARVGDRKPHGSLAVLHVQGRRNYGKGLDVDRRATRFYKVNNCSITWIW